MENKTNHEIEIFPMSWLYDKVSDIEDVLDIFKPLFTEGAFLAGGFLRTAIAGKSATFALDAYKSNGDLDFFFKSSGHAKTLMYKVMNNKIDLGNLRLNKNHTNMWIKGPNSIMKYAYNSSFDIGNIRGNLQFISRFGGSPFQILNGFDIANCKIATDGKDVYVRKGWEKLEEDKVIHIDDYQDLIPWRVIKYINKFSTKENPSPYNLSDESKTGILEYTVIKMSSGKWGNLMNPVQRIKTLLQHKNQLIKTDDVLFFMNKLGTTTVCELGLSNNSTYVEIEKKMKIKDFAVHIYEQRKKKEG